MPSPELRACPFCGDSRARVERRSAQCWFVFCASCACEGPWHKTTVVAIRMWNKRHDERKESDNAKSD